MCGATTGPAHSSGAPLGAERPRRLRVRVEGMVQGVGFRPHAHRLASQLGLAGHVRNDERGVLLEVEGPEALLERFLERLVVDAPPLARVERLDREDLAPGGGDGFRILESSRDGEAEALVAPDTATCTECLAELFDLRDRRYRYPFVNCTNCGPRFTIVAGVPYDRPLTTMAPFTMCGACRAEYEDPAGRRFHAQPNACPACGPSTRLVGPDGRDAIVRGSRDAVDAAARAIEDGLVVAVKGLGGFHLACLAGDEKAVAALRARKRREEKPFALMARDLETARELVELSSEDERLLASAARPIVVAPRRPAAAVADAVAPRSAELGVMLPYSPLHHVLAADVRHPLVLTSGNLAEEPIAFRDAEALERLSPVADRFLLHDREIRMRTDDSVARAVPRARPIHLRRSRGEVPAAIDLPLAAGRPLLACGAELKAAFCLVKGRRAFVSHHIGDLRSAETLASFREGIAHLERLFAIEPEVVAHDLHPDYLSTVYALERPHVEQVAVQHHHAHLAACLAEHGEEGPALGAIFDGSGLGPDGTVWGGELLAGGLAGFERAGHLSPVRLPGGDRAVREPWRMACAWLAAGCGELPPLPATLAPLVEPGRWEQVARLALTGFAAPLTTSVGRLFDAVAALCGIRATVSYEGQAALELEAVAAPSACDAYPLPVRRERGLLVLDARETVAAVVRDVRAGVGAPLVSARFHEALARATARACAEAAAERGLATVVLSGGAFQNVRLLGRTTELLAAAGLRPLRPELLPPNDGGIAYGQAAVAARLAHREGTSGVVC